ncbi:hypothetical protein [Bartonella sp. B41]
MPIPSQASKKRKEGVETERAAPKKQKLQGEETVQTTNSTETGDENRSGMNPGVAGSNPAVDTITLVKLSA